MMIMSEEEFKQIYNYIENPDKCQKGDKFAQKYALVVCNATYKDKAGLQNLLETKEDFKNIQVTVKMMKIKQENMILLTDVGSDELDQHFDALSDKIMSHT